MIAFVFDTETTGLILNGSIKLEKQPRIIEFYGALANIDSGKVIKEYDCLVNPGIEIPDESKRITGITDDMVAKCKPFSDHIAPIYKLISSAQVVVAHNARYDVDMVNLEAKRIGKTIKWPRIICTVEQTVHLLGYRASMENLYMLLFNQKFADAHRAGADGKALLKVVIELRKRKLI